MWPCLNSKRRGRAGAKSPGGSCKWNFPPGTVLTLPVRFLAQPFSAYSAAVLAIANLPYARGVPIRFVETAGPGVIRVSSDLAGGGWSEIGNDAAFVPPPDPTMNIGLPLGHPDFEGHVLHEFLHALGMDHTHQAPVLSSQLNRPQVEADYAAQFGWTPADVWQAVFAPPGPNAILITPHWESGCAYPFTGPQHLSGVATHGSRGLTDADAASLVALYAGPPPPQPPPPPPEPTTMPYHYVTLPGHGSFLFDTDHPSAGWSGLSTVEYNCISPPAPDGSTLMTFPGYAGVYLVNPTTGYRGWVHSVTPKRLGPNVVPAAGAQAAAKGKRCPWLDAAPRVPDPNSAWEFAAGPNPAAAPATPAEAP